MSDRRCKYCRSEIRWCLDDRGHWLAIDLVKVPSSEPGAQYVILGSEDARRIPKANLHRHSTLYRLHQCEQGKNAKALAKRQREDSAEAATARRQLAHELALFGDTNVVVMSSRRRRG
jgi:hypothetical protein